MAEYVLGDDEDQAAVAAELLANADHPDDVVWRPRSNLGRHAGVYEVSDALMERLIAHRSGAQPADAAEPAGDAGQADEPTETGDDTPAAPAEGAELEAQGGDEPPADDATAEEPPAEDASAGAEDASSSSGAARKSRRKTAADAGAENTES